MANDGAIRTSSQDSPVAVDPESISLAEQLNKAGVPTRRPWRVMFDVYSMGLPRGVSDAFSRIKTNLVYFETNYGILVLFVTLIFILVSLIKHPISFILFAVVTSLWFFLCFIRDLDESIKLFSYHIYDRAVLSCLMLIIIVLILLTKAMYNIAGTLLIGAVLVLIHAVVRRTEDLFLDEEDATTEFSWIKNYYFILFLLFLNFV